MNREPSAASLLSAGLSRMADVGGVVLLVVLGWRMFFVFDSALQTYALIVGVLGAVACWTDRSALKNAPLPMLAWVGIALLSAAVHRWADATSVAEPEWWSLFTPAFHLVVMAVFVYGTAHLLRTPRRLSLFTLLLVASISVLAVQILFDRASAGFVYIRGGSVSLPSVPHWGGIHGTSLLLTLGLPLALSISLVGRSWGRILAGILLGAGLLLVAYFNGSRGGLISMVFVSGAMALFAAVTCVRGTWRRVTATGAVLMFLMGLPFAMSLNRASIESVRDLSARTPIWEETTKLALDNPWLGVGPENHYAPIAGQRNAHNLLLHVGAEIGVFGALSLLVFAGWALRSCWRAWAKGYAPIVSLGLLFALAGFLVHSVSENFLDARAEVERTRVIVWMVFAAVLAVERLPRHGSRVER